MTLRNFIEQEHGIYRQDQGDSYFFDHIIQGLFGPQNEDEETTFGGAAKWSKHYIYDSFWLTWSGTRRPSSIHRANNTAMKFNGMEIGNLRFTWYHDVRYVHFAWPELPLHILYNFALL